MPSANPLFGTYAKEKPSELLKNSDIESEMANILIQVSVSGGQKIDIS